VPDQETWLAELQRGNVLALRDGRYFLTFPVITGSRREAMAAAVEPVAEALAPRVAAMREEIVKAIPGHEDMAFHLLWSRVVDQRWCRAWQREGRGGDCPPGVDWVLYPPSPFTFGTHSWGNDFAVTWNSETRCAVTSVVTDARVGLLAAAGGTPYAGPNTEALQRLGLVGHDGRFHYDRLAASLGIAVDQLWVILFHETAYAVFADLSRSGSLHIPVVLTGAGELTDCRETVSFLLHP
jgi:hypothetical protein